MPLSFRDGGTASQRRLPDSWRTIGMATRKDDDWAATFRQKRRQDGHHGMNDHDETISLEERGVRCPASNCGVYNVREAVYCAECGVKIASPPWRQRRLKTSLLAVAGCVIAGALLAAAYLLYTSSASTSEVVTQGQEQPVEDTTAEPAAVIETASPDPSVQSSANPVETSTTVPDATQDLPHERFSTPAKKPSVIVPEETVKQYLQLGKAFHDEGNYDKAIEMFERVRQKEPSNGEAWIGIRRAEEAKMAETRVMRR